MACAQLGSISIIVPAYNAERDISGTLNEILRFVSDQQLPAEIIVVDDASTDTTPQLVAEFGDRVRLIRQPINRGKGAAVRLGMSHATMHWALFLDADHSTRIEHLLDAAPLAGSADVLIGSRRAPAATMTRRPLLRRVLGDLFPAVTRRAMPDIRDTQCGFKLFRRWTIQPIFSGLKVDRFAFDLEALLRARRLGATIREFPVQWNNPPGSTLRVARDAPRMLADALSTCWRLRPRGVEAQSLATLGTHARAEARRDLQDLAISPTITIRSGLAAASRGEEPAARSPM